MKSEQNETERLGFAQWVRGTFWGWLLGFVLIIVLAMAWDMIGGGAQFMIGIGMGAGVGFAQGRVARQWLNGTKRWVWASVIGMGVPFVVADLVKTVGFEFLYSLPLSVAMGGLLVGWLQRRLLFSLSDRANWWVPACLAGWSFAAGTTVLSDSLRGDAPGLWGALLYVALVLCGGVILGVVTGAALQWMLRRGRPAV